MNKFRIHLCDALIDLIFFLVIEVVASIVIYYFTMSNGDIVGLYAMFLPFSFLFFLRMRRRNFFLYSFCHLALYFVPFYMAGTIFSKAVFFLVTTAFIIYSYQRYNPKKEVHINNMTLIFICAFFTAFYTIAGYYDFIIVQNIILISSVLIVLLYFLYIHIMNVDKALSLITMTTIQPIDKIIASSNRIILFFIILTGVLLFLSRYFFIDDIIRILGTEVMYLFGIALKQWQQNPSGKRKLWLPLPGTGGGSMSSGRRYTPLPSALELQLLLERGIKCAIIVLTILIIYMIYKLFNSRKDDDGEDIKEFVLPEIFIHKSPIKSIKDRFAPGNKIRRIFYKKVKSYVISKKVDVRKNDTAYEMSQKIMEFEDIGEILKDYEKIRYDKGRF